MQPRYTFVQTLAARYLTLQPVERIDNTLRLIAFDFLLISCSKLVIRNLYIARRFNGSSLYSHFSLSVLPTAITLLRAAGEQKNCLIVQEGCIEENLDAPSCCSTDCVSCYYNRNLYIARRFKSCSLHM